MGDQTISLKPKVEQVAPTTGKGKIQIDTTSTKPEEQKSKDSISSTTATGNQDKTASVTTKNEKSDTEQKIEKHLTRNIKLPAEPAEDKPRVLLAVKLPNGQRVQRFFSPTDQLEIVLNFAELSSKLDLTNHEIVCDAPRKIFSNMTTTIQESGLENRTVVHVQYPDE